MNRSKFIRIAIAAAFAIAIVPASFSQESKKAVPRTVIVKDGQVYTSDNPAMRNVFMVRRGFLGVQMVDLTPELRQHFHVAKDAGVLVSRVTPESPAAKAGVRVGDIITSINGTPVDSPADIARAVRDRKNGDTVRIDYSRDGVNATTTATVVERERKELDLRDLDIEIPELPDIPDVGKHMEQYFNSPEWKAKMEHLQHLPDCNQLQKRMQELEVKMKELSKKLGEK